MAYLVVVYHLRCRQWGILGVMSRYLYERTIAVILLVIAGGVVFHAPLTVGFDSIWPEYAPFIKAWKELLMGVAFVLLVVLAIRRKMLSRILSDRLMQIALAYAGLHFLIPAFLPTSIDQIGAGLLIDLRYIFYFVLVYVLLRLVPEYKRYFIYVLIGTAVLSIIFALLQIFVLPKDVLSLIGYSRESIAPFLTVDDNHAYVRINGTLRGPNPLGAYVVILSSVLLAYAAVTWKRLESRMRWIATGAGLGLLLVMNSTYSRASLIGLLIAAAVIIGVVANKRTRKILAIAGLLIAIVGAGALFAFRDNPTVASVVFHDDPNTGSAIDSNAGHADSLIDGFQRMVRQPFGAGIGSTGSASLAGDNPLIIENQYLFIAHEVGWLGLVLFVGLFAVIMKRLWVNRQDILALSIFASGCGLAVIGILHPVWVDDTVSIVWWGAAAVALSYQERRNKSAKRKGKSDKKATRTT